MNKENDSNKSEEVLIQKENVSSRLEQYKEDIKRSRYAIIGFAILHFFFEALMDQTNLVVPVLFNYFIAFEIIKARYRKEPRVSNAIIYSLKIYGLVFAVRLILGFVVFSFLLG